MVQVRERGTPNEEPEAAIAAIGTTDVNGKCIRRVTAIPLVGHSARIESAAEPSVLDAIRFQAEVSDCYARRRDSISCDGRTDYSAPRASVPQPILTRTIAEAPVAKKVVRKKQVKGVNKSGGVVSNYRAASNGGDDKALRTAAATNL